MHKGCSQDCANCIRLGVSEFKLHALSIAHRHIEGPEVMASFVNPGA